MAYCKKCGTPISDGAVICPSCGAYQNNTPYVEDRGGFGWSLLGCCIPIVGLVLFLVWRDQKPRTAKAAGIGALVSVILCALWYLFVMIVGVGAVLL